MAEGRSDDFKKHFLGTHFFNPPRYLKLLEVIPTKHTDPAVVTFMKQFGENVLGKGVVLAKDTPNFIANRIGTYGLLVTVREMMKGGYSVGEVDSVTGINRSSEKCDVPHARCRRFRHVYSCS